MANLYGNICTCTRCNGVVHTIRRGDTLYLLSRHYNVSVNDIMNANRNVNIYNLRIGDEICIPVRRVMDNNMMGNMRDSIGAELREEISEELQEELHENFMGNTMNQMSAESIEVAQKADNIDVESMQIRENNRENVNNRRMDDWKDKKLGEILNMDMTFGEFVKLLKEFD